MPFDLMSMGEDVTFAVSLTLRMTWSIQFISRIRDTYRIVTSVSRYVSNRAVVYRPLP